MINPTRIFDNLVNSAEDLLADAGNVLDRRVRLGVTGLSRAGKTIFISSLVHHLLHPGRLPLVSVMAEGRYDTAMLLPSPTGAVPRFHYEDVLRRLIGTDEQEPAWPGGTTSVSELRLTIKFRSPVALGFERSNTLHLDIVDYPGEWLLDLPLLDMDYATWSRQAWDLAASGGRARFSDPWRVMANTLPEKGAVDEQAVIQTAAAFRAYLQAARAAPERFCLLQPGRFLLPGDMEGAPALTFFPLPKADGRGDRGSLARLMSDRFESYKREVVEPFFRQNLAQIDRQVVLVDLLDHLAAGPESIDDLQKAIASTLGAFRHGENSWLSFLLGRKIDKMLFVTTKADHLHSSDHEKFVDLLSKLVGETSRKLAFNGTKIGTQAIAALRVTDETKVQTSSGQWPGVSGLPMDSDHQEAVLPGRLPKSLEDVSGDGSLASVAFRPRPGDVQADRGMRSLRLDRAVEFLLGDALS
jgi:predicted YcjX-like family ATPase